MGKKAHPTISAADLFVSTVQRHGWTSRQAVAAFCFVLDEVEEGLTPDQRLDFHRLIAVVLAQCPEDPKSKREPR